MGKVKYLLQIKPYSKRNKNQIKLLIHIIETKSNEVNSERQETAKTSNQSTTVNEAYNSMTKLQIEPLWVEHK